MPEEQTQLFNEVTDDYPTSYLATNSASPFITTVTIKNFKRIEDDRITFAKMSVLTGVNNSGKSTILQAIWVAFECLRLCVDRNSWEIAHAGRALVGFEFLPANEPQDLWFGRRYRSGNSPRAISIRVDLSGGFFFETQINLYFGAINVKSK